MYKCLIICDMQTRISTYVHAYVYIITAQKKKKYMCSVRCRPTPTRCPHGLPVIKIHNYTCII